MTSYDLIIIGGGISGFSAAMYAGRMKLKTLVIVEKRGGTIVLTNEIANWPGINMIDGMGLAKQIEEHALEYGVETFDAKAVKATKSGHGFSVEAEDGTIHTAKALILATGTEHRKLEVKGEDQFKGKGVHYCALCDGFFYKGKTIAVVGGSDSAAKEALLLTQWVNKVYVIARSTLHPEPINAEKVKANAKIEVLEGNQIKEILGEKKVNSVMLTKPHNGSDKLALDGIFVEIGHVANSELAKQLGVSLNDKGEIKIDRTSKTNVEGVFAAGDVTDTVFKQAITGSAEGVHAAVSAYDYLEKKK
jgi:thioredoxin-disulfide reductase